MSKEALSTNKDSTPDLHSIDALTSIQVREGVVLRLLQDQDGDEVVRIIGKDPTIAQRVTVASRLKTPADVAKEVEKNKSEDFMLRYVIEDEGKVSGMVSFWRDNGFYGDEPDPRTYGFGYFLDPEARGKGLVGDSIKKIMDVATEELEVDKFIAYCEDNNMDSIKALTSVGLQPTDTVMTEPLNGWSERRYELAVNSGGGNN